MQDNNGKAVASFVLGIISVMMAWFGGTTILGLILAIIGVVIAIGSRKEYPSSLGTAGLILSIIAICLNGLFLVCWICIIVAGAAMTL